MKQLSALDKHMLRDMMNTSDKLISELLKENNDIRNIVVIERIANIMISRLRRFLRTMDEKEILELTKELTSLRKMRIAEKRLLGKTILKFLS
ncbi:MAG: hypothetical protein J6B49_02880 [Phascolarctobacterium sp.]|nr:hypothetical protein [Phascolarctobacterium sp.]